MAILKCSGELVKRSKLKPLKVKCKKKTKKINYKRQKRTRYLYCLLLEDSNYYIGQTTNLENRIKAHKLGKGAGWTRLHKPIKLIESVCLGEITEYNAMPFENDMTQKYALMYGANKVRGGDFCQVTHHKLARSLLQ